jgi:hypothetical protein
VPQVLKVTHGLYRLQTVTHPPPRLFIDFEALSKYLPAHGQQNGGRKNRLKPLHGVNERNDSINNVGSHGRVHFGSANHQRARRKGAEHADYRV